MRILSIVHEHDARTELFEPVIRRERHSLEEWSPASGTLPPGGVDSYDAALIFGGAMHVDQEQQHPWLRDENLLVRELIERRLPLLGVCLGAQLIAKAAGARVHAASKPELGWHEVALTAAGTKDPVLGALPERFAAFQMHEYTYELPEGAAELARSEACTQAFRLGDAVWAVQFHPEVTEPQVGRWLATEGLDPAVAEPIAFETSTRIGTWNELGRTLCGAWLAAAEDRGHVSAGSARRR